MNVNPPTQKRRLSRGFIRGFLIGLGIGIIALGAIAAFTLPLVRSPGDDSGVVRWPAVLREGSCASSGIESGTYVFTTTMTPAKLAAAYADQWSATGWDVTLHQPAVDGSVTMQATRSTALFEIVIAAGPANLSVTAHGQTHCAK